MSSEVKTRTGGAAEEARPLTARSSAPSRLTGSTTPSNVPSTLRCMQVAGLIIAVLTMTLAILYQCNVPWAKDLYWDWADPSVWSVVQLAAGSALILLIAFSCLYPDKFTEKRETD